MTVKFINDLEDQQKKLEFLESVFERMDEIEN
eukprot:CAMPEP_0168617100 /NCGR_PEP_ID=MMETSP0449_2-20121227/5371_1 /TAXON_ID=1082188 /ORGANISM="Strombidium rassoulzadegani, Strain ras09" /LENGTH=31 /DNA_ID= /DNA_START= /DNA_END= /DNA_ORIENTATION=